MQIKFAGRVRVGQQNDLKWLPLLPGCGTQHPHRALGGTCVLLAAAPTTPPCFRRWRRSSSLLAIFSGKIIFNFAFVALCGALQTHFHGRSRNGKRHLQRRFLRKRSAADVPVPPRGPTSPGRGKMSPQVTKRGICRAATEGLLMEKRKKR